MFKTVKAKIIIILIMMLTFLMSVFACYTIISRMKTKQLMVQNYKFSISSYVDEINDSVLQTTNNLNGLALIGG